MQTKKYVAPFAKRIQNLMEKLNTIDKILSKWMKVQTM